LLNEPLAIHGGDEHVTNRQPQLHVSGITINGRLRNRATRSRQLQVDIVPVQDRARKPQALRFEVCLFSSAISA
jgi:hypothetical protein